MCDVGYVSGPDALALFFRGFTSIEQLFDVIDTGDCMKETAWRIGANFESDINDLRLRCKHLILGCSHDSVYMRIVDQYKYDMTYDYLYYLQFC